MIGFSVAPAFFRVGQLTGIVTVYDAVGLKVDPGLQYTVRIIHCLEERFTK